MPNHLLHENSPYLLQHADNPVDWYPYGAEAIEKARIENKPIFLSIGYAACHWCHVMEHESFTDDQTAVLMNDHFINIKVDREERPDVDAIYMRATVALTGSGGWPMSVFLTPDLQPFFAGTYFPPVPRYNMPSFKDLLYSMSKAWEERRDEVIGVAQRNHAHLIQGLSNDNQQLFSLPASRPDISQDLEDAVQKLLASHDDRRGGWGSAPKFPQPMVIDFLLRQTARHPAAYPDALDKLNITLRSMARGGMNDLVGGGFCRYSTDADWLVPHFEKMLYDNAQLALVYLHAYQITKDASHLRICQQTLDFIINELTDPSGGFYSSLDADSEGVEGKFYIWGYNELKTLPGEDLEFLRAACVIEPNGNWEGNIIPRRSLGDERLAAMFNLTVGQVRDRLDRIFQTLRTIRDKRVRPTTDDKVLVMWNALAIRAFSEAGRVLNEPKYIQAAKLAADHILGEMVVDGDLKRGWRKGNAKYTAYLEDHAALAWALVALYQSDPDPRWYRQALDQVEQCFLHYADGSVGFFDTHESTADLLLRPKDTQDNATPCGNALAACAMLELSAYGDRPEWRDHAEQMIRNELNLMKEYPTAFGQWLIAASILDAPIRQLALVLPFDGQIPPTAWEIWQPNRFVAILRGDNPDDIPAILRDRPMIQGKPTAYLCENFICSLPTTDMENLI